MHLNSLLDLDELDTLIGDGYVSRSRHPELPISILNYTQKCMFKSLWTPTTIKCRGLIYADNTLEVVARGVNKFFNWGQAQAPVPNMSTPIRMTRKEDGSLGIGWTYNGVTGIATRGSFLSEQATYATEFLMTDDIVADIEEAALVGATKIYEIVFPEGRIVLDYGDRKELIPLGTVFNYEGLVQGRPSSVTEGPITTLHDALKVPVPADEEGFVLDILDDHGASLDHVKVKGHEYLQLHAILTSASARRIWVELATHYCHKYLKDEDDKVWATRLGNDPEDFKRVNLDNLPLQQLMDNVPDEFYDWVVETRDKIEGGALSLIESAGWEIEEIRAQDLTPKEQFEKLKGHPLATPMIRILRGTGDKGQLEVEAWRQVKPQHDTPFMTKTED